MNNFQAKFVLTTLNEIRNFERGLDPKSSMDIGKTHLDKELIKKIPWDLNLLDQPKNEIQVIDFVKDYKGFPILVYLDILQTHTYTDKSSYQATSTMDHTGYCTSIGIAIKSMKKRINNIFQYAPEQQKKLFTWKMSEAINFERGIDPKKAMSIGKKAQLNKLDKETDWGFEISTAFDRAIWDIIKYNGDSKGYTTHHLIKITKVSGSDEIGYYMALNDSGEPYNSTPPLYPTPEEALDWEQKYLDQLDMGM